MPLDSEYLDVLACPHCKGELHEHGDDLRCDACAVAYPVHDGIPMLFVRREASPPRLVESDPPLP